MISDLLNNAWFKPLLAIAVVLIAVLYYALRADRYRRRLFLLGYISTRWKLRFFRRDYSGCLTSIAGSYYTCQGHTRSCSSVLSGRQRGVPIMIFDYRFELGSRAIRQVVKKTVIIARSESDNPPILLLYGKTLLPVGRYAEYSQVNVMDIIDNMSVKSEVRTYLKKCNMYSPVPEKAAGLMTEKFLNYVSRLKGVDFEIFGDNIIIWSDLVVSKYLLIQHAARAIGCARILNI